MTLSRRGFLSGLTSMLAAPAIVHAGNLMPVKAMRPLGLFPIRHDHLTIDDVKRILAIMRNMPQLPAYEQDYLIFGRPRMIPC